MTTVTQRLTSLPTFTFRNGPAAGDRPVLPDVDGSLPTYVTVTEPLHLPPWQIPLNTHDRREHVYRNVRTTLATPPVYEYVRTIEAGTPRITCPDCGNSSTHPQDIKAGYCAHDTCHAWSRIPRFAVLRGTTDVVLPPHREGRWIEMYTQPLPAPVSPAGDSPDTHWIAVATGEFERNDSGGYAEVHEARRA